MGGVCLRPLLLGGLVARKETIASAVSIVRRSNPNDREVAKRLQLFFFQNVSSLPSSGRLDFCSLTDGQ